MDLLSDILSKMQLKGTLYFKTSFTTPWSIRVPSYGKVARFHFAYKGRCYVRVNPDEPPICLEQGDLLIIWGGVAHTLYCDPKNENSAEQLENVIADSGFTGTGALTYGEFGTDHETQLICGHFEFEAAMKHPFFNALPDYIHIQNYGTDNGLWLENTLKIIANEVGAQHLGGNLIATKLSEIILAQALRIFLHNAVDIPGLSAFMDDKISLALNAIHKNPEYAWDIDLLAKEAGMSRTNFSNLFLKKVGMSPFKYLTFWRMHIAQRALVHSNNSIIQIAQMVGYNSEEAFGRAFKNMFLTPPATYRRNQQNDIE